MTTRLTMFLSTVGVFTVLGIVVGYLIASSIQELETNQSEALLSIIISYVMCSLVGLLAGVVISFLGLWLFSPSNGK